MLHAHAHLDEENGLKEENELLEPVGKVLKFRENLALIKGKRQFLDAPHPFVLCYSILYLALEIEIHTLLELLEQHPRVLLPKLRTPLNVLSALYNHLVCDFDQESRHVAAILQVLAHHPHHLNFAE